MSRKTVAGLQDSGTDASTAQFIPETSQWQVSAFSPSDDLHNETHTRITNSSQYRSANTQQGNFEDGGK
jgi:hypothetical protein